MSSLLSSRCLSLGLGLCFIAALTACPPPQIPNGEDDHANSATGATLVNVNGAGVAGGIDFAGDVDYFRFVASAGDQYIITTTGTTDTFLRLWNTNGTTQLLTDDDGGAGTNAQIIWTAPASGTYFTSVEAFFTTADSGNYTISITQTPGGIPDLIVTAVDVSAQPIEEGDLFTVTATIENAGDADAGASHVEFFVASDVDFDTSDDVLLGEEPVPPLIAGDDVTVDINATMPDLGDGSYTVSILVDVDSRSAVFESNEDNVFRRSGQVSVEDNPIKGNSAAEHALNAVLAEILSPEASPLTGGLQLDGSVLFGPEATKNAGKFLAGETAIATPGAALTLTLPFDAPGANVTGVALRFGASGMLYQLRDTTAEGNASGSISLVLNIPAELCAYAAQSCEDIYLYTYATTATGAVSHPHVRKLTLACGDCGD